MAQLLVHLITVTLCGQGQPLPQGHQGHLPCEWLSL